MTKFDLLSTVEYGGCSAKLSAKELQKALADLPRIKNTNLLVDIDTHDDAGVYKINDDVALILTTDFFPPVCSDPYDFGQIAAANSLSDVYAMGGDVLAALNIVMFPAKVPLDILKEILHGGTDKVLEAGGVIAGGHTIVDDSPKYGLAVTGTIHPDKIITNAAAKPGDKLILTKPVGAGLIMAGHRIGEVNGDSLKTVLDSMKQLNKAGALIMQKYGIKCATDVTGFGMAGHAMKMALGSSVTIKIDSKRVPFFDNSLELLELGCIPGACFRNLEFVENDCLFEKSLHYNFKMLLLDAQTSGGLLMCAPPDICETILTDLIDAGYIHSAIVGEVIDKQSASIIIQ